MLSNEAFEKISAVHDRHGVPTAGIWDCLEQRITSEDPSIIAYLKWALRARVRQCFFETWSPYWFGASWDSLLLARAVSQLISASAISVIDAIVDQRIRPESPWIASRLNEIALQWASDGTLPPYVASGYRRRLAIWSASNHGIKRVKSQPRVILLKNPFYPLWGRAFGIEPGRQARSLTIALGLLDDAADVREDFFRAQPNSVIAQMPENALASPETMISHCLRHDMLGVAVQHAIEILKALSSSGNPLLSASCRGIEDSLAGYADLCRLRLVAETPVATTNAVSSPIRKAIL